MLKALNASARRLLLLCILMFLLVGTTFTVFGAALPQIIRTFHWSYTLTGLVLSASAAGYVLGSFLCGLLVERIHPRTILVTGLLVGAVGLALFARSPSPWLNLLLCLAIGVFQGTVETVINYEIVHMESNGQSRIMNLAHAFFSVGAILGPLAMSAFISRGLASSLAVFAIAGGLSAALAAVFAVIPFPRISGATGSERGRLRLLRNPVLLLLTLFLMLYVGAELGVSNWVSEFLVTTLGSSAILGAFTISLYWIGLLAGRLAISFAYRGRRQELLVIALGVLSTASLVAAVLSRSPAGVAAGILLTGLGFSGMYPLVMAMVGRIFRSGVAVGTAAMGGGLGSFALPFLMAVISQGAGIRGGFWYYAGLSGVLVLLGGIIASQVRPSRKPRVAGAQHG